MRLEAWKEAEAQEKQGLADAQTILNSQRRRSSSVDPGMEGVVWYGRVWCATQHAAQPMLPCQSNAQRPMVTFPCDDLSVW